MEFWNHVDEHFRLIIQISLVLSAIALIIKYAGSTVVNIKNGASRIAWLFTEEHNHEIIKESLEEIKAQFFTNNGHSLKDDINIIKNALDFNSSYMRVINHANTASIFETDTNGEVVFVNRAFARMTGFSKHEVMGTGWINLIYPQDREKVKAMWNDAVKSRRDFDEHITYVKPDGTPYPVHAIAHIIRSTSGHMLGHFGQIIPEAREERIMKINREDG
jgi:PAS domain S-box-containing protein